MERSRLNMKLGKTVHLAEGTACSRNKRMWLVGRTEGKQHG
jgi:hypothetical protein